MLTPAIPTDVPIVVVGLAFGDESKGATVDHLCATRDVGAVVRFNGGAQAAHNVIADGVHRTARLFGSGSLTGTPTFLAAPALVDPVLLAHEGAELEALGVADPFSLLTVDPDVLVTTAIHQVANRTREDLRGAARHGSTGLGIGETTWFDLACRAGLRAGQTLGNFTAPSDAPSGAGGGGGGALRVRDLADLATIRARLVDLERFYYPLIAQGEHDVPSLAVLAQELYDVGRQLRVERVGPYLARASERGIVVAEGAQGVLLDETYGFHPFTTWSTTRPSGARAVLAAAGLPDPYVLGLTRSYTTRHGAGPLPSEDASLLPALPEPHNAVGEYQGSWRVGHLDLVALDYARQVVGRIDGVAVSHLEWADRVDVVTRYEGRSGLVHRADHGLEEMAAITRGLEGVEVVRARSDAERTLLLLERTLRAPVVLTADGPTRVDRREVGGRAMVAGAA